MIFGDVKEILNLVREMRCDQIDEANKSDDDKDIYWKLEQLENKIEVLDLSTTNELHRKLELRAEDNANMFKKLETMVNEFKGCIAMSRASLQSVVTKSPGRPKKAK